MDQERFDDIAKKLSTGSSRRSVLGAAIAGAFGAGLAKVSGADGKGKKKSGKRKVGKEFVCTAANANLPPPDGCGPGFCCASTNPGNGPNCIAIGNQAGSQFCGDPAALTPGEGVCRTCPAGTRCSGAPNFLCVCDSVTCANGCCYTDPNTLEQQCIVNGSGQPISSSDPFDDGSYVCGTGGSTCNFCSVGPQIFSGCCSATGVCQSGTSGANCGTGGNLCETCNAAAGEECGIDQTCTGGTTTTTTTPGPQCIAPKHPCGSNCCGRKQKCITNPNGTLRCKKKHKKKH